MIVLNEGYFFVAASKQRIPPKTNIPNNVPSVSITTSLSK
jgi:hypothetical protein